MRRPLLTMLFLAACFAASPLHHALAQDDSGQSDDDKKKKDDWGDKHPPIPTIQNAGPCPLVKVLYDAARYVELKDNRDGSSKTYRYWVAVTDRNRDVIDKTYFNLPVNFPAGQDRVLYTDTLKGISIPRASAKVSGANFEVLVGFDVTPEMVAFNRDGKRFKPSAVIAAETQSNSTTK
jgi:hypothetical protein